MKKLFVVLFAALLAVAFSAFTPTELGGVFYKNSGSDVLLPTSIEPCPGDEFTPCRKNVPEANNELRILYQANGVPYRYDEIP